MDLIFESSSVTLIEDSVVKMICQRRFATCLSLSVSYQMNELNLSLLFPFNVISPLRKALRKICEKVAFLNYVEVSLHHHYYVYLKLVKRFCFKQHNK